jgi:hypothetical protein
MTPLKLTGQADFSLQQGETGEALRLISVLQREFRRPRRKLRWVNVYFCRS